MTNLEIAELLRAVAAAYQLKDEKGNRFKIVAYQRAADAVEHATSELKDLWDDGKLEEVPGIGPSIAEHLDELFRTGKSKHFEEVMKGIPPEAFKLMELPGIGIKTAIKFLRESPKSEIDRLLGEVKEKESESKRHLLPYAATIASELMDYMLRDKNVERVDSLGSLRRRVATVGDIDIAVSTDKPVEVLGYFTKYPKAQKVLEKGARTAAIMVPGNIQVDLMVETPDAYGSLLQHFTGSKHHNIALREYALKKGLSLSEYGIKEGKAKELKKFRTEEEFYNFLGLDWIPPELRENAGEIEAARENKVPNLVELKDIKGDLQIHSDFDIETSHDIGDSSMGEIIEKSNELGYQYIAFTEHNPSKSKHNAREITNLLMRKAEAIDKINYSISRGVKNSVKKVFNSLEIDMLSEGGLPVPEEGLATLDFALISIHSSFRLNREEMTKRVLSALSHPKVRIFAHPTGRKLNEREGVELNWDKIFEFCLRKDKWLEINCDPMRLDLPDTLVHEAVKQGVKLTLGTDAHYVSGLNNMRYGVSVARRGWAEAKDIVNTRSLQEFEKMLK